MTTEQDEIDAAIAERFRPFIEFHAACVALFCVVVTELRIVRLVDWVWRRVGDER